MMEGHDDELDKDDYTDVDNNLDRQDDDPDDDDDDNMNHDDNLDNNDCLDNEEPDSPPQHATGYQYLTANLELPRLRGRPVVCTVIYREFSKDPRGEQQTSKF